MIALRFLAPGLLPALVVASIVLSGSASGLARAEELGEKIDGVFEKFDKPDSPGCAVAVVTDGKMIHNRGYGSANLDYRLPMASDSVFYLASVSKQFTAACIALLAQEGKLSLDDDIRKYFPELPEYEGGPISVRHLVHHTSGLRDYLALMGLGRMPYGNVYSDADILGLIARQKETNFPPGEKYLYSNTGYFLLAQLVKRASGKTLREYAQEKIFGPLGMNDTHFHDNHTEIINNRVISYMPEDEGYKVSYLANFDQVGSGGLLSTVDDLILWDRNFDDNRLGSEGFLKLLHSRGKLNDGSQLDYAFGLSLSQYKGLATVGHGGSMMGFRTEFVRFPDERLSVIVLSNLGTTNSAALARRVADVVLVDEIRAQLAPLAGKYRSDELQATFQLELDGADLVLQRPDDSPAELTPEGKADAFRLADAGIEVRFTRDASSHVTGLVVDSPRAKNLRFDKIGEADSP